LNKRLVRTSGSLAQVCPRRVPYSFSSPHGMKCLPERVAVKLLYSVGRMFKTMPFRLNPAHSLSSQVLEINELGQGGMVSVQVEFLSIQLFVEMFCLHSNQ
jgi:hypothetical protein